MRSVDMATEVQFSYPYEQDEASCWGIQHFCKQRRFEPQLAATYGKARYKPLLWKPRAYCVMSSAAWITRTG
jgi:hypothetical protein